MNVSYRTNDQYAGILHKRIEGLLRSYASSGEEVPKARPQEAFTLAG